MPHFRPWPVQRVFVIPLGPLRVPSLHASSLQDVLTDLDLKAAIWEVEGVEDLPQVTVPNPADLVRQGLEGLTALGQALQQPRLPALPELKPPELPGMPDTRKLLEQTLRAALEAARKEAVEQPVWVHRGFLKAYESVRPQVLHLLDVLLEGGDESAGGATSLATCDAPCPAAALGHLWPPNSASSHPPTHEICCRRDRALDALPDRPQPRRRPQHAVRIRLRPAALARGTPPTACKLQLRQPTGRQQSLCAGGARSGLYS